MSLMFVGYKTKSKINLMSNFQHSATVVTMKIGQLVAILQHITTYNLKNITITLL